MTTYSIVPVPSPRLCPLRVLNAIPYPLLLIPLRFVKMNFLYFVDGMMSASRGGLKSPLYAFVKYMHTHSIDHLKLFHAKHQSLWQFKALYHMLCRIDCIYVIWCDYEFVGWNKQRNAKGFFFYWKKKNLTNVMCKWQEMPIVYKHLAFYFNFILVSIIIKVSNYWRYSCLISLQVKIWFQNHRYKCKRQAKEKAMAEQNQHNQVCQFFLLILNNKNVKSMSFSSVNYAMLFTLNIFIFSHFYK